MSSKDCQLFWKSFLCVVFALYTVDGAFGASPTVKVAFWNVGHFAEGHNKPSYVTKSSLSKLADDYRRVLTDADADIVGIAEYNRYFDAERTILTKEHLFGGFRHKIEGIDYGHYNSLFIRDGALLDTNVVCFQERWQKTHYVLAHMLIDGRKVAVVTTHLVSDVKQLADPGKTREAEMQELVRVLKDERHAIVCGDFNVTAQTDFRPLLDAGFLPANHGTPTWPSKTAWPNARPRDAVDNIFAKGFTIRDFGALDVPPYADHLLIRCTLDMVEEDRLQRKENRK